MRERVRRGIHVDGVVQGVGYRPFVYALARRYRLDGFVGNDARGVFCEVEGPPASVDEFVAALRAQAPPLAVVEGLRCEPMRARGERGFAIVASAAGGERQTLISPDTATCEDCLRELLDPADRRFRHPFVNCTNCGPRFTIVRDVPYDRPATTMAGFPMCEACRTEYHDPADRRFHAQPVCCPACGPALRLLDAGGRPFDGDPIEAAVALLAGERVVAIKGLGGYHLAALAASPDAVAALRTRKHREEKPFAVMAADVAAAATLCRIDEAEARALAGIRRPIVLLRRRAGAPVADAVAPGNRRLGVMLPYTPLHHLLARDLGAPFVLTSGNRSDEPIAYRDDDALERLAGIADAFLVHDRPIHVRADDSVVRVERGREQLLRRARGYAPQPVRLARGVPRPVLACGAELKSTFCLAKGDLAFVSHHIGDLEDLETLRSYTEGIEHYRRLFDVDPAVVAHDLHPEYLSTKHAHALDLPPVAVQHHHAHVASCLADNGVAGPVIGVAFDGLGYGSDGTLWGGEILIADLREFTRAGHLATLPMPGGAAAIREPWRMAAAWLDALGDDGADLPVAARNARRWEDVRRLARAGVASPATSSAGRLFDAVAALLDVRDRISYEGQAAIELEQRADPTERGRYRARIQDGEPFVLGGGDLVAAVVADRRAGVEPSRIAARFHAGVASLIVAAAERAREQTGLGTIALSGGVFQNALLVERTIPLLQARGFAVLTHRQVPPNDGGISLGQAAVAGARDAAG